MKKTVLALTLCAVMATAMVGCGERREPFPDGSMETMDPPYATATDRRDTNADNGAYNSSFGNTGSATNPSAPTDGAAVQGRARRRAARRDVTWEQMLENGRVHDRDGFLLDGENTAW